MVKIGGNNSFPIRQTAKVVATKNSAFFALKNIHKKDQFSCGSSPSPFVTKKPTTTDFTIDISSTDTPTVWWPDELLAKLPDAPCASINGIDDGLAKPKLFSTLKSLAKDSSYLRVNLLDGIET